MAVARVGRKPWSAHGLLGTVGIDGGVRACETPAPQSNEFYGVWKEAVSATRDADADVDAATLTLPVISLSCVGCGLCV